MIWFSADHHLGHENILRFENRPFSSIEEHDETLIKLWNESVKPKDSIYYLGDFSLHTPTKTKKILDKLNGRIFFINGNHDRACRSTKCRDRFEWMKDIFTIKINLKPYIPNIPEDQQSHKITLCHFAMRVWVESHYGSWHVYGHCLDEETEILTQRGWLHIDELELTDRCYSYNTKDKDFSFQNIDEIHRYRYTGSMYSFEGKRVNFRGTEHHKHLLLTRYNSDKYEYVSSKDLGQKQRWILCQGSSDKQGLGLSDDFLRLYVWINADGSFENGSLVRFHLKKRRKISYLTDLLDKMDIKYSYKTSKIGTVRINFSLPSELRGFSFKPLDFRFIDMNRRQVSIFFEEYANTDGYRTARNCLQIYSSREQEIDIIQNICVQNGFMCNKIVRHRKGGYIGWVASVNFSRKYADYKFKGKVKIEEVKGEPVWCITTKNSNFLIRRNGKTHFTGNSHSKIQLPYTYSYDVGVDGNDFKPVSIIQLYEIMEQKRRNREGLGTQSDSFDEIRGDPNGNSSNG